MNKHYRKDHEPIRCKDCGKLFNMPSGLHKHSYIHLNHPYSCDQCRKTFPFFSQLKSHKVSHTDMVEYTCDVKDCGKEFKRKNEYEQNLKVHDEVEHHCTHPGCDYTNYDERNSIAHQKIHTPYYKRYICLYCGQGYLHYTQRTRHYANECTKISKAAKQAAAKKVH